MSLTKGHWASLLKIQFSLVWFLADSVKEGRKLELVRQDFCNTHQTGRGVNFVHDPGIE